MLCSSTNLYAMLLRVVARPPQGVDLETGTLRSSAASGTSILRDRFFSAVSSEVAASEDGSTLSQVR